jgi:hypothetical protein
MRLATAIVLSVLAHAVALGGFPVSSPAPRPSWVPLDVAEAPPVPPPPEPAPPPAPSPAPPKKKRVKVRVASEGLPVAVADAGVAAASEAPDAGPGVIAKVDPATLDLRPFLPPGERVMVALRGDRLRATPWAPAVDAVLAPMPDYRLVIEGTGLGIADTFDTVVIASPAPRDVTQTFLAGRTEHNDAELRRILGRGGRVTWGPVAGGTLGRRTSAIAGDARVLLVPAPGWFLLVRPEHVAELLEPTPAEATPPPWLAELGRIDEQTGDALAVLEIADAMPPWLPSPQPERLTTALTLDEKGMVLTGAAFFADEAAAKAFHDGVVALRRELLASLTRKVLLRAFHVEGAATRLQLALHDSQVTFSTSLTNAEAAAVLEQAAAWTREYFAPHPLSNGNF